MKVYHKKFLIILLFVFISKLFGQSKVDCFLKDFEPKPAVIPPNADAEKTLEAATVSVTINTTDTLARVSKYIFGNAVAVWVKANVNNPVVDKYLNLLSPAILRFPGGSWSNIYFWDKDPGDLPSTFCDGTKNGAPAQFSPELGPNHELTADQYYDMRTKIGNPQGLITINYGYARYGLSNKPAEQAAHMAANWVRYDKGRTKYWEIGNENGGPWEVGWQIDTTKNKDGQPKIINGELYGRHFKIFADSMRAAAKEVGTTIYIGGQVLHFDGTNDWNVVNHNWNEGFFKEVGDAADFYVFHNYFGNASTLKSQVDNARSTIISNINFIRSDMKNKNASLKPIALSEWNLTGGPPEALSSIANGMQAVVLFSEMAKNNVGMSCRWLIANWDRDGMFYYKNPPAPGIPLWNPRPDFFYIYYLQKFTGDHSVSTALSPGEASKDIIAYSSIFSNKHIGIVIVNRGNTNQVIKLIPRGSGVGEKYYVYSLTGSDSTDFCQTVIVNGVSPSALRWGPIDNLADIKASAYRIDNTVKFDSPARSVQYVIIEAGLNIVSQNEN